MSPIETSLPDRRLILRYAPAPFVLASAALLLTAYLFQHVGGLHPCPLCVAQRYPHFAVLGLGLAALLFGGRARWLLPVLLGAIVIAYLVGAGYAAFHVGVEAGHFQSGCAGAGGAASSIEELRARIEQAPLVRCDEVAWTLFGVSVKSTTTVRDVSWMLQLLLSLASNLYVPQETMPGWLQAVVDVNPITYAMTAVRGLMSGTVTSGQMNAALLACAVLFVVFAPLTVYRYLRRWD